MLTDHELKSLKQILEKHINPRDYNIFIFGSRADGTNRQYSDVDIGITGNKKVDLNTILDLKEEFEESTFPYSVDIVDFANAKEEFKKVALKHIIPLYE